MWLFRYNTRVGVLLSIVLLLALVPVLVLVGAQVSFALGAWRVRRFVGHLGQRLGIPHGESLRFQGDLFALREECRLQEAAALARARIAKGDVPAHDRNAAIDVLISAGEYRAALEAEPPPEIPKTARDALSLALIQVNLAEAEYNLGRWEAAQSRLEPVELAAWPFAVCRAGLLVQLAWIAAHTGRPAEALELLTRMKPGWLPRVYRAECYYTGAVALMPTGRTDEAEAALMRGERMARRQSSRRNALFLRARLCAARGDWEGAEKWCRAAAAHPFRGQGGEGLLLWARALVRLGREREAEHAFRLVRERDPESEAAREASGELAEAAEEKRA